MSCKTCSCRHVDGPNYEITLQFPRASQAAYFLSDLDNWVAWKNSQPPPAPDAVPKKEGDKRGQHTRELHKKAREYQALHPLLAYHECMRLCTQTI